MRERTFDIGDRALHVAEGPETGPPLVLLHGITSRWQGFLPLLPFLTQRYHVFAVDLRGHGRSARAPGHYTVSDYASDVVTLIEEHIGRPATIYGHSLGGLVALHAAFARPDLLNSLVIGDSPLSWGHYRDSPHRAGLYTVLDLVHRVLDVAQLARQIAALPVPMPDGSTVRYGDLPSNDGASIRAYAANLLHVDPDAIQTLADGRLGTPDGPLETLVGRLTFPVLLMQAAGNLGGLMASEDVTRMLASLPDGTHVRFPGLGHSLHGQDPVTVARALLHFLEALAGPA